MDINLLEFSKLVDMLKFGKMHMCLHTILSYESQYHDAIFFCFCTEMMQYIKLMWIKMS